MTGEVESLEQRDGRTRLEVDLGTGWGLSLELPYIAAVPLGSTVVWDMEAVHAHLFARTTGGPMKARVTMIVGPEDHVRAEMMRGDSRLVTYRKHSDRRPRPIAEHRGRKVRVLP